MIPQLLLDWLAEVRHDPLAFAKGAFPWGEGVLERFSGPEPWQAQVLEMIRVGLEAGQGRSEVISRAIQIAVASGHGVGKSALVSWIIIWAMSTCPDTRGVVTANTEPQLKSKTWAELGKWYHRSLTRDFFKLSATALYSSDSAHERTWRVDMIPWSKERPEAFAGLHNQGRRIILIFDEASAIEDAIWETAEGALTDADTEIIWCVYGNPTRNSGRFKECFPPGKFAEAWQTFKVDSRTVSFTDKKKIEQWSKLYGDDSDFFRIRVKGEFPRLGDMEFFSSADVDAAMSRDIEVSREEPLAVGVDVARFGQNSSVIFPRKGRDARSIPRQVYNGLSTVDLATKVFEFHQTYRTDGIFIDGGGVGGGVVDSVRHMHLFCHEVQFGSKPDYFGFVTGTEGEKYANKRAEMYGMLRGWLRTGAIPLDAELRSQLLSITYTLNNRDEIILTSKEVMMREGKPSPDDVDGLACTFALPLASHANAGGEGPRKPLVESEYDPFSSERMVA